jgi:predicted nucleic-acid-binding Zn-ribbon protein
MTEFQPPTTCIKCGGQLEEGLAVDNSKQVQDDHPAFGENLSMGGSPSWWRITPANPDASVGVLGHSFKVAKIITGEKRQIFSYRCSDCGYLESYAPDL